jgi:hypothetical protein
VTVSERAVAISRLRLRSPKLILRHCGRAQGPFGYIVGRFHSLFFQKCEQPMEVDK